MERLYHKRLRNRLDRNVKRISDLYGQILELRDVNEYIVHELNFKNGVFRDKIKPTKTTKPY